MKKKNTAVPAQRFITRLPGARPGPQPKYGKREDIHVQVPVDDLIYITSVSDNRTEWIIAAIREKRQREEGQDKI